MFKTFIALFALFAFASSQQTSDEKRATLIALGFSSETANGLVSLGEKDEQKYAALDKTDPKYLEKAVAIMGESKIQMDEYLKTIPAEDQAVFVSVIRKIFETATNATNPQ